MKPLAKAKSRLHVGPLRTRLALAFAQDTVRALQRSQRFGPIFVVTSDPVARNGLSMPGVAFLDDKSGNLNAAVERGVSKVRAVTGARAVAVVMADLPAASPEQFSTAADRAITHPRSIVGDSDQKGTTMLLLTDSADFRPTYGAHSRAAHLLEGCVELDTIGLDGIRRDVDTVEHLREATKLGLGEHTQRELIHAALDGCLR